MKVHVALLSLLVFFASAGANAAGSTRGQAPLDAKQDAQLAKEVAKPTPAKLSVHASPAERHLFPVRDEKGLLLTCVAPELDKNSETDFFKDCTLAPGRTLDDVMHSFVKAIHQEQQQSAASSKEPDNQDEEKTAAK